MPVYVDDMYRYSIGRFRGMAMSHMIADSTEELLWMADLIGMEHRWIQKAGTPSEHFDISYGKRELAIEAGAIELTMRELVLIVRERRRSATVQDEQPRIRDTS